VTPRGEDRQIFLRQREEFNRRSKTTAVLCVGGVLEMFLKMHEGTGGLNQPFEKIIVFGIAVEPKLLQDIVRLVVALLVPAVEERAIKWMVRHVTEKIDIVAFELTDEPRNPLAFAHEGLNFIMPQMMGKPTFPEGHESVRDRSQE